MEISKILEIMRGEEDDLMELYNDYKHLMSETTNKEEFIDALREGGIEEASNYHEKSTQELKEYMREMTSRSKEVVGRHEDELDEVL